MSSDLSLLSPLVLLVLAPVGGLVAALVRSRPSSRRASLERFARRVDLPVPVEGRAAAERSLTARNLATDLGAVTGVVVLATWATVSEATVSPSLWPFVVVSAAFVGAAVGAGLTAAYQATRPSVGDGPRIARPTAPTLGDYVAPLELTGGRVASSAPLVVLLAAVAVGALADDVRVGGVLSSGPVTAVVLALAALVASEAAGRRLIQQPQTAHTDLELAWSDAVRARVLRDIVTVPIAIGTYATFGVILGVADAVADDVWRAAANGALGVLAVVALLVAIASTAGRPQRHFRRRLWPRAGAGAATGAPTGARP